MAHQPQGPLTTSNISFDAIGSAVKVILKDMGTWLVASLVVVIAAGGLYVTANLLLGATVLQFGWFVAAMLRPVLSLPATVMVCFLLSNVFKMCLNTLDGKRISATDVVQFDRDWLRNLIAAMLIAVALTVGFGVLFIPGVILGGLMMFTYPLMIDRRKDPASAIITSVRKLMPDLALASLFFLAAGFCTWLGLLVIGIGVAFTLPILPMSICIIYRRYYPA